MKGIIGWVSLVVLVFAACGVMGVLLNDAIGPEAQERKIQNRDYMYEVHCTINGKTVTENFLNCYSGESGLRCGNGRSTSFLCQGNYSYTVVDRNKLK